jgi:hypothetical protein
VTIPVSTVPAAEAYLLSAIQTQAALDPSIQAMLIRLGEPGRDLPNDSIVVGTNVRRTVTVRTFIGSGGTDWLNEGYDMNVECRSWLASGDADDTSVIATQSLDRAWQLVGYVETAIRTDPSLGGLVNLAYPRSAEQEGPVWVNGPAGAGLITLITINVHVEDLN